MERRTPGTENVQRHNVFANASYPRPGTRTARDDYPGGGGSGAIARGVQTREGPEEVLALASTLSGLSLRRRTP
jgi:hypothetical protein